MGKVVIVGLDGATWDLLLPLAEQGFLPNLRRLCSTGAHGDLESTIPPVTAPAWASFATGKNPGKTGIFGFLTPAGSLRNLKPVTSADIACRTFYELLDEAGKKSVLVNLPLSYPPRTAQPTITSIVTQGDRFVFPRELMDQLPELKRYRLTPNFDLKVRGDLQAYIRDIRDLEEIRFRCCQKLFDGEWDLFFVLFSGTDWVQHEVYDRLISRSLSRDHNAFLLYRDIDSYLGWYMENMPDDACLFVMSDHGFKAYKGLFFVNHWLRQKGLLTSAVGAGGRIPPQHRVLEGILEAQTRLGVSGRTTRRIRVAPPGVLVSALRRLGFARLYAVVQDRLPFGIEVQSVDYSASSAVCTTPELSGIYLNTAGRFEDGILDLDAATRVKDKIVADLRSVTTPGSGAPAFERVHASDEVYSGALALNGPDIVMAPYDHYLATSLRLGRSESCFEARSMNGHSLTGILAAYGPGVKRGARIEGSSICDLAPTILHCLDTAVPGDMDGKVLSALFEEDSDMLRRPVRYSLPDGREEVRRKVARLKRGRNV